MPFYPHSMDIGGQWRPAFWRRGWDSNPRYACTHNGFRDRPDRPLWHLSEAPLIRGRNARGNACYGVDLQGFLRIFRAPWAGPLGPPRSFMPSGILGLTRLYP